MTIQELHHIIEISGIYDMDVPDERDKYINEVFYPLATAILEDNTTIIDYLMQCVPEELFYLSKVLLVETLYSSHLDALYNKMIADNEHIQKVIDALKKQHDTANEADPLDDDEEIYFDIKADMAEGIRLNPKQIELWEKIIERERLIAIAREKLRRTV
jgi:hypothetical protein